MAKTTKKLTKELLMPVKFKKVEEKEEEKSLTGVLDDKLKEYEGEVKSEVNLVEKETQDEMVDKTKAPQSVEELIGVLNGIEKSFEGVTDEDYYPENAIVKLPETLGLEKVEVPEINEDEIRKEVSEKEIKKTETEKDMLKESANKKKDLKTEEMEETRAKAEREKEDIQNIYDDYKVSVESDAIKRGLARSSVALLSLDNVEAGRAKELSRVAENLTASITGLEREIIALQEDLERSLDTLDLELADNINSEIKNRIDELEKKRREAIEFNNEVSEMEANYQIKKLANQDEATKLEEELAKRYEGYAQADKREKKVQTALDYFNTLNKTEALKMIISSPELAETLGDAYYDIYYYTMRR